MTSIFTPDRVPEPASAAERGEQHGGLSDREHGGVADRIGHSRTSVRLDICERTSLLPRSCAPSGHLTALGVSLTCQPSATGNGSLTPCRILRLLGSQLSHGARRGS